MKRRGLLNKHFCKKKNPNIPNETGKIVNFLFPHYKSMGIISCHSNQSSYPLPIDAICEICKMNRPYGFRGDVV